MLETCRVRRVTGDGNIHVLLPHDGNALTDIVSAVAANAAADTIGVLGLRDDLHLTGVVVELCLYVGEAVDTGDNLGSVLSETVKDDAERFLTNLVGHLGDLDSALGGGIGLVTGEEREALRGLAEKTGCEVAVSETYLTVISD